MSRTAAWVGAAGGNMFWPFGGPTASGGVYPTDPYTGSASGSWPVHVTSPILAAIVATGADHIRLQVSPGPWLQAIAASNTAMVAALFADLDVAVNACLAAGVGVMLSPYMSGFLPIDVPTTILQGIGTSAYLNYKSFMTQMCSRYANFDLTKIAIGTLNEPPDPSTFPGDWPGAIQPDLYAGIRAVAPGMTIALTGANYSSIANMTALSPAGYDANVLWEFHPFVAAISQLQGYTNSDYQFIVGLKYPPIATNQSANVANMTALVNASSLTSGQKTAMIANLTSQLGLYYSLPQNITWIATQYALVSSWCTTNKVSPANCYAGEWGMTRLNASYPGAARLDRVRSYRDHAICIMNLGCRSAFDHWDTPDYTICSTSGITIGVFDLALLQAISLPRLQMLRY